MKWLWAMAALLAPLLAQHVRVNAIGLSKVETRFSFYSTAKTGSAPLLHDQTTITLPTTIATGRITGDVAGNGAGNVVFSICSDGTTCAAGNVYLTCSLSCTASEGVSAACTVTKSAVAANTTLSWVETTTCSVQDPGVNVHAKFTQP